MKNQSSIEPGPGAHGPTSPLRSPQAPEAEVGVERAWVGVVSNTHVQRGVAGGFAQLCHGKQAPLARMRKGDWLIYYSPATEMRGGEPLQAFTALGRVLGEQIYPFQMAPDFVPFRRDIGYLPGKPAPLAALREQLHFTRSNWGLLARRGHFEIDLHDRDLIAAAMGLDLRQLQPAARH